VAYYAPYKQTRTRTDIYKIILASIPTPGVVFEIASTQVVGAPPQTNGGIVMVQPHFCVYGDFFSWSDFANQLTFDYNTNELEGDVTLPSSESLIRCYPTRGGGRASVVGWTETKVVRGTLSTAAIDATTNVNYFLFEELPGLSSLAGPNAIANYGDNFFWIGKDNFYVFTGTLQPLPNEMMRLWFFDNVNSSEMHKIFAFVNPRYDEIMWFFPKGTATENNHVLVYNVKSSVWFDTPMTRSCGIISKKSSLPILADTDYLTTGSSLKPIWLHEIDKDIVLLPNPPLFPEIRKLILKGYFQTKYFSWYDLTGGAEDLTLVVKKIIPDFVQEKRLVWEVWGKSYPQSKPKLLHTFISGPDTEEINVNCNDYLISFKVISNEIGGSFQMGRTSMICCGGDKRP
jgi:hypothetical protein